MVSISIWLLIFRKDVRLPVQLQRAMAAEAEAAREARAKVSYWSPRKLGLLDIIVVIVYLRNVKCPLTRFKSNFPAPGGKRDQIFQFS